MRMLGLSLSSCLCNFHMGARSSPVCCSYEIVLVTRQQEMAAGLAIQECRSMHAEGPHLPPLTVYTKNGRHVTSRV